MSESTYERAIRKLRRTIKDFDPTYICTIQFNDLIYPSEVNSAFKAIRNIVSRNHKQVGMIWYLRRLKPHKTKNEAYTNIHIFSNVLLDKRYIRELLIKSSDVTEDDIYRVLVTKWKDNFKIRLLNNKEMMCPDKFKDDFSPENGPRLIRADRLHITNKKAFPIVSDSDRDETERHVSEVAPCLVESDDQYQDFF
jgi:hypothetical protein